METGKMSALQKLVHASQLLNLADNASNSSDFGIYKSKLVDLLDTVSHPPGALIGNPDPEAWARAFAEHFGDSITAENCYAWLSNAMLAGAQAAQTPSYEAGRAEGMKQAAEGFKEMADTLGFIRAGVDGGKIKCPMLTRKGQEDATLQVIIADALTAAGLE